MTDEGLAKRIAGLPPLQKAQLERRLRETAAPPPAGIPRLGNPQPPLSFAQERLWFLDQLEPGLAAYNLPLLVALPAGIAERTVEAALARLVQRHEVLRSVVASGPASPRQHVLADAAPALPCHEMADAAAPGAALQAECARPFALGTEPPLRCSLWRAPAGEAWLLLVFHHIACDGGSLAVVRRELDALLAAPAAPLPPLPLQYGDYAQWQRDRLAGPHGAALRDHWLQALDGAPDALALPCDRPPPQRRSHAGAVHLRPLATPAAQALRAFAQAERCSLFAALLTSFLVLLHRVCDQQDLLVGIPATHRSGRDLAPLVGLFVNTLAIRSRPHAAAGWRSALQAVRAAVLEALEHQDLPFEQLVAARRASRDGSRPALVQAFFALQNDDGSAAPRTGPPPATDAAGWSKFELTLTVVEASGSLDGVWEYSTERFDAATVHTLAEVHEHLLVAALADPERPLRSLPLAPAAAVVDGPPAPTASPSTLHACVAAQAQRTPEAIALLDARGPVSYRLLMQRVDRLARRLAALGAGPGRRIGLCLGRHAALVEALLAVLQAGAAYVPLDPEHPAERLAWMARDAQLALLLTDEAHRDPASAALTLAGPTGAALLVLDTLPAAPPDAGLAPAAAAAAVDPDELAYILYTSGSTGRPKGVMVSHRAVVNHMQWLLAEWPLGPGDRVLQRTSPGFDASVLEFFAPLMSGACLVLSRHASGDLPRMAAELREQRITVLQLVPSLLQALAAQGGLDDLPQLRLLFCGGEALPASLVRPLLGVAGRRVVNLYGPTEAAIDATFHVVREPAPGGVVPIGRPIAGVRAVVLDEAWNPVPHGVAGELFLGGVALARGYLGRPDLTADRFVPDACSGLAGERLYRTGDRVRRRTDGTFEYLGRSDGQVKLRGVRIELAEIEEALAALPAVAEAAVAVRDELLVAWIVPRGEAPPSPAALRSGLQSVLPRALLPSVWHTLAALPRLRSGKLDRAALAARPLEPLPPAASHRPPRTPTEQVLAALYAELLGAPSVGLGDDFFQLGGHSLLATQLASRVQDRFGVAIALRQVFDTPGVEAMAACIDALCAESAAAALVEAGDAGSLASLSAPRRQQLAAAVEHLSEEALDAMLRLVPDAAPLSDAQEA